MPTRLFSVIFVITFGFYYTDSARICMSCSGLTEGGSCQHVQTCLQDEVCFTQKYRDQENITKYDQGCSYPELCRKDVSGVIFGKRESDHSHVLCHHCCNETNICNFEPSCEDSFKAPGQLCLSCSGIESPNRCSSSTECATDEVCFLHKYLTEMNQTRYDLGCKRSSYCLNSQSSHSFGRREPAGRHLLCESCCIGPGDCNRDLQCMHSNIKTLNGSCSSTNECKSNLVCESGTCRCHSTDYYWTNETCDLRKVENKICGSTDECKESLICSINRCTCPVTEYWNGSTCSQRRGYNAFCTSPSECHETLYCVHETCKCDRTDYWTGSKCMPRKDFNNSCSYSTECKEELHCLNNRCNCKAIEVWNGISCEAPKECRDLEISTDGVYIIYPEKAASVYCVIEDNKKWTVIQRRENKTVDFNRTWNEYKIGFGNPNGEYWLGNENIHLISSNGRHQIRIKLETSRGKTVYADYSTFSVGDEASKYILIITGYSGTAGNAMDRFFHVGGHRFSTPDQDNDAFGGNCAASGGGGWWYSFTCDASINHKSPHWFNNFEDVGKSLVMITKIN